LAMHPQYVILGELLQVGLNIVLGLFWLYAVLLVTSPEPRVAMNEDPINLRKIVRVGAVVAFVGGIVSSVGQINMQQNAGPSLVLLVVGGVRWLGGIVAFLGLFLYYRPFAQRIPNPSLAAQTRTVMWGFVISYALLIVIGAGILIGATVMGAGAGGAPPPDSAMAMLAVGGIAACAIGIAILVFGIWSIVLLVQYNAEFGRALVQARGVAY